MEIVISGYYGFDNVGDEAILLAIIRSLKQENPHIQITVLSNLPEKTKSEYGVNAVNRWNLKEVICAIKAADGLISGGGGLLQDRTGNKSIAYYTGIMWLAHLLKKPFFIYSQGVGPIQHSINRRIVASILSKASLITVRDDFSKQYIECLEVKKDVWVVADPVLALNMNPPYSKWLERELNDSSFITVTVRRWFKDLTYLQRIAEGLSTIAEKGKKIVFVPMHGTGDANCSHLVLSKMTELAQRNTYIAPHDLSTQEKASIIGASELLVGMRLHSLIFAALHLTPFLSISYDPKIDSFTKLCGQTLLGQVEDSSWNATLLTDEIEKGLDSKAKRQNNIRSYTKGAKEKAQLTATVILDYLSSKKIKLPFTSKDYRV